MGSSDMMGRDMSSNMMVNNAMGQKMYTMGKDMSSPMIGSNMGKMMRQNMYQIVPSWDEPMEDIAGNVGNNMDKTMMGAGMVQNMGHNMMGHNMDKNMMDNNVDKTSQPMPMEDIAGNVGNNMDNTMMGAPMVQNMGHNMMGHNMDKTMMGAGMVQNMGHNMMGHNMDKNMMDNNVDKTSQPMPMPMEDIA